MRRTLIFLAIAALWATVSSAALLAQRTDEDTVPRTHLLPAFGVHVGTPQKASVALGVIVGRDSHNTALFVEPGLSGGRASVAYLRHGFGNFGSGFGIAGSVLRTWNDPWTVSPNMTFVGAELIAWPVVFVGPRIGLFHAVSGRPTPNRWLVTIDFGLGV